MELASVAAADINQRPGFIGPKEHVKEDMFYHSRTLHNAAISVIKTHLTFVER